MTTAADSGPLSALRGRGPQVRIWALRFLAALLLLLALWLALALISHNPKDPSYLLAADREIHNWMGAAGADVSVGLRFSLGRASWVLPILLSIWAFRLARGRLGWMSPARLFIAVLGLVPLAGFVGAYPDPDGAFPGLGGRVGDIAILPLAQMMAAAGSSVPYVIPGLLLGALAAVSMGYAAGLTGAELKAFWGASAPRAASGPRRSAAAGGGGLWRRQMDEWRMLLEAVGPRRRLKAAASAARAHAKRLYQTITLAEPEKPLIGASSMRLPPPPPLGRVKTPEPATQTPAPDMAALAKAESDAAGRTLRRSPTKRSPGAPAPGPSANYPPPPMDILASPTGRPIQTDRRLLEENGDRLIQVLDEYGVRGKILDVKPGPVVTLYELEPAPGLKAARVVALADDIARSMSAAAARVAVIPGRNAIGVELPNPVRDKVLLREMLESDPFRTAEYALALALGKTIGGDPMTADLAKMPHLLIAGTTGSGKSVAINTMILSLLYRLSPRDCRLIMIDPKVLELSVYDGIPHLLAPVVTDPKKAVLALKWTVREMERRYQLLSSLGVRNLGGYNERVVAAAAAGAPLRGPVTAEGEEGPLLERLPLIVVVVDEMADLMLVAGKEVEHCVQRLAQMARASGIHIIMATQRPSVDVITGTIKANFPTRISFQVTSKIDSRTILGEQGAEQLLGQGDMLYMSGGGRITRLHGPFVRDDEVAAAVKYLRALGAPQYIELTAPGEEGEDDAEAVESGGEGEDDMYRQAVAIVARDRKVSTSYIQRKLAIGYNRAARIVDMMEDNGVVGPPNNIGKREVLIAPE